jgi:hypothetical protein
VNLGRSTDYQSSRSVFRQIDRATETNIGSFASFAVEASSVRRRNVKAADRDLAVEILFFVSHHAAKRYCRRKMLSSCKARGVSASSDDKDNRADNRELPHRARLAGKANVRNGWKADIHRVDPAHLYRCRRAKRLGLLAA